MNRQVQIQNLTILAPLDSPNTDGINPGNTSSYFISVTVFNVIHIPVLRIELKFLLHLVHNSIFFHM